MWADSPFGWMRSLPSATKGKVGATLVERWFRTNGIAVTSSPDPEADLVIDGNRVEVKTSLLWRSGRYRFQQVRDQRYDLVVCLGISPRQVHWWVVLKQVMLAHASGQHLGHRGSDTKWLSVVPDDPPRWLRAYGGTPSDAVRVFGELNVAQAA